MKMTREFVASHTACVCVCVFSSHSLVRHLILPFHLSVCVMYTQSRLDLYTQNMCVHELETQRDECARTRVSESGRGNSNELDSSLQQAKIILICFKLYNTNSV
jgi:hypothetical protein